MAGSIQVKKTNSPDDDLLERHFHSQVPAGHHDAIRGLGDFVEVLQRLRALHLGDDAGGRVSGRGAMHLGVATSEGTFAAVETLNSEFLWVALLRIPYCQENLSLDSLLFGLANSDPERDWIFLSKT